MTHRLYPGRVCCLALTFAALVLLHAGCAQRSGGSSAAAPTTSARPAATQPMDPVIAQIRDEGMNRSKVMETLDYLCDVIGPRLTGSESCKRASEWTRDTLKSWGLSNAAIEPWGPFGRGWQVKRFSFQIVEPYTIVLNGYPKAWSPGFEKAFEAPVVYLDATNEAELEKYKGKLKGAVVFAGAPRAPEARYEPLAKRISDEDLAKLAAAEPGSNALLGQQQQARALTASERRAQFAESGALGERLANRRGRRGAAPSGDASNAPATAPATEPATRPARGRRGFDPFAAKQLSFAADEGALVIVGASSQGDGGTFFVQSASIPGDNPFGGSSTQPTSHPTTGSAPAPATTPTTTATSIAPSFPTSNPTTTPTARPRVWAKDAPKIPAQVTLAVEDYNRVVRMIQRGGMPKMAVDLRVKFNDDDEMSYNTVAEIPGTDPKLKDQIVMVGAHLDSWHSGTGATDNGAGSAAAMEAVRIIKALNLKPRRTIRVGLWTGEEQGLFGSAAYVKQHFGFDPEPRSGRDGATSRPTSRSTPKITKLPDYERLSVYFNLDNGTGKIRGIYAQGNEAAIPYFQKWLATFADVGAKTITMSNTGSTDHISFDAIGLPGFQFIQDPIEYSSRTHHSNEDVYDRAQAEDLKQASTIMAAFLWNAANMDERFPRKPVTAPTDR